jgi:hypothetical protein
MNLRATVRYRNAQAHFELIRECERIYCADLLQYEGAAEYTPPATIVLLRGLRYWWGSAADKDLVNALGEHIDSLSESALFFTESNTTGVPDKT